MFGEKYIGCCLWHMEPTRSKLKRSLPYFLRNCQRNKEPGLQSLWLYSDMDLKLKRVGKLILPAKNCKAFSALKDKGPIKKLPAPSGYRVFTRSAWEGPSPDTDWWWLIVSLLSGNFHGSSYGILVIPWLGAAAFSCDLSVSMCAKRGWIFSFPVTQWRD